MRIIKGYSHLCDIIQPVARWTALYPVTALKTVSAPDTHVTRSVILNIFSQMSRGEFVPFHFFNLLRFIFCQLNFIVHFYISLLYNLLCLLLLLNFCLFAGFFFVLPTAQSRDVTPRWEFLLFLILTPGSNYCSNPFV